METTRAISAASKSEQEVQLLETGSGSSVDGEITPDMVPSDIQVSH